MNTRLYSKEPTKGKILHRLSIARGHLDKVVKMVNEDDYCIDVIHQSQAVQSALKKIDEVILQNHLQCCVFDKMDGKDKKSGEKLMSELVEIFRKSKI
jgi:CsoR family transcriptional regulator, copper-sensing transcriptional repressor